MKEQELNILMKEITDKCKMPKYWNEFIEKRVNKYHIILKDTRNKNLYCTNCENNYYDKHLKIGDYTKCPKCNKKSYIYSVNFRGLSNTDSVILTQKNKGQIVFRVFDIWTFYNRHNNKMDYSVQEYARYLPGIGKFINRNVEFNLGGMQIYHFDMPEYWYSYNGCRNFTGYEMYPFNKKRLIKGTNLEYAPINECLAKFSCISYIDALMLAANESFELLWNMKLYNLSLFAKHFNKKGSFYKRFKITKDYLMFMQENDITYRQLMYLKLIKKKDIGLLKNIANWNFNCSKFLFDKNLLEEYAKYNNTISPYIIETLKEIEQFTSLKRLRNYPQALEKLSIYRDYLVASQKLDIKLISKEKLFPEDLIKEHDEVMRTLNSIKNGEKNREIWTVYLKLSKYTYNDDKYIIFPATSAESMKEEGRNQSNCVGCMYLDSYANSNTEIYFMRDLKNPTKSLITLEYKKGQVVQKELPEHSTDFTDEQNAFIDKWLGFRSFTDKREKVKNKANFEVKQYNLNKLVA